LGILSTFLSGVLGQALIWMHNQQQMGDFEHQVTVATGPPTASLLQRLLAQGKGASGGRNWPRLATVGITLLLFSGCAIFPFMATSTLLSFELRGLAGLVAQQGWVDFNLLTVTRDMTPKSEQVLGTQFLTAVYVSVTLVVPGMLLFMALILWFVPLHLKTQRTCLNLFPFWFSWCALDTLLVTSIAAYLELHMIGEFTFDHKFRTLCLEVREIVGLPCVALGHHAHQGMLVLGAACAIFFLVFFLIARLGANLLETARMGTESPNTLLWANRPWERESPLIVSSRSIGSA
jgi:hypothetical protein